MGLYFNIALFLPYKNYENKNVFLKGYVVERNNNNEYVLKVEKFDKYKLIKRFKIKVYTNNMFEVGDCLLLNGVFSVGEISRNYKGFNYKNYLRQNGIMGIVNIDLDNNKHFIKKIGINKSVEIYISIFKENLNSVLETLFEMKYSGFMQSVLLGNKVNLDNEVKLLFSETFLSHVLAISGMHVGIILNSIKNSLNKVCKSYKLNACFQIFFLFFFYIITGMQISCFRTVLFNLFVLVSKLLYEKSNITKTVIYTYIILIVVNVYNIINIALYLSLFSSVSIILFNKFFNKLLDKFFKINIKVYQKIDIDNNIIIFILKFIKESFVISISAQILIIPIMIYFFNYFTFKFFITNLFISIFIGFILKVGYIALGLGLIYKVFLNKSIILKCLLEIISIFIEKLLCFIFYILEIINKVNILDFYIVTPSFLFLIVYYIFIIWLIYEFNKNPYRNFRKIRKIRKIKDIKKLKCFNIYNIRKNINDLYKSKTLLIISLIVIIIFNNVVYFYRNKRV